MSYRVDPAGQKPANALSGPANGPGRTELEQLHLRANQITDDSLESTRRMLMMCEESKDAGIRTLVALDEQGEQLDRVEEGLDKINSDIKEAERNLTGLEKFCGLLMCPCGKKAKSQEDEWKAAADGVIIQQPISRIADDRNGSMAGVQKAGYIARVTNDAREDEMEGNMVQVGTMLGNLRNMAVDMGSEISQQNHQLDRVNRMAESNRARISEANMRAQNLLK